MEGPRCKVAFLSRRVAFRDAVETVYGTSRSSADDLVLMRQSFGSWADRKEDGASMVEGLRSGSRLARNEQ